MRGMLLYMNSFFKITVDNHNKPPICIMINEEEVNLGK